MVVSESQLRFALTDTTVDTIIISAIGSPYLLEGGTLHCRRNVTLIGETTPDDDPGSDGPGSPKVTINGQGGARNPSVLLAISPGVSVVVHNLTLTGAWMPNGSDPGQSVDQGGGAVSNSGTLTMYGSRIERNHAYVGAGIFSTGVLLLIECYIGYNTATFNGGGLFIVAGIAELHFCIVEHNFGSNGGGANCVGETHMYDTIVRSNSAFFEGGGVRNNNLLTLTRCTITDNLSLDVGGGVQNSVANARVEITDSLISRNSATNQGGGLLSTQGFGGNLTFVTCVNTNFTYNKARQGAGVFIAGDCEMYNSIISYNNATNVLLSGAGLYNIGRVSLFNGCILQHNSAPPASGGTVYNGGRFYVFMPTPLGYYFPASFLCKQEKCEAIGSTTLAPCAVQSCDYARYNGSYMVSVRQGEIDENLPYKCAVGYYGGSTNVAAQRGFSCSGPCPAGMVCDHEGTVVPQPCPPGSWCTGGQPVPCPTGTYSALNVSMATRASQLSCQACPASATTNGDGKSSIDDCGCEPGYYDTSERLDRDSDGHWLGPKCVACPLGATCNDFNTTVNTRGYQCPWLFSYSGVPYHIECADDSLCDIYYDASGVTVTHSTQFENNTAYTGGAIYVLSELHMYDTTLNSNRGIWEAGAVHNIFRTYLEGCTVEDNYSGDYGGGIQNSGQNAHLTLIDTIFARNVAESFGGGLFNTQGGNNMTTLVDGHNVTFRANRAPQGAGIHNTGTLKLNQTSVEYNNATGSVSGFSGAGLYNIGEAAFLGYCKLFDNHASGLGRTIYNGGRVAFMLPAPKGFFMPGVFNCKLELCERIGSSDEEPCTVQSCNYREFSGENMVEIAQGGTEDDLPFPCAAGYYGNSIEIDAQKTFRCEGKCPPGTSCPTTGFVTPGACEIGKVCAGGESPPANCPPDSYCSEGIAHRCPQNMMINDQISVPTNIKACIHNNTAVCLGHSKRNLTSGQCECLPNYYDAGDMLLPEGASQVLCFSRFHWLHEMGPLMTLIMWGIPGWASLFFLPLLLATRLIARSRDRELVRTVRTVLKEVDASETLSRIQKRCGNEFELSNARAMRVQARIIVGLCILTVPWLPSLLGLYVLSPLAFYVGPMESYDHIMLLRCQHLTWIRRRMRAVVFFAFLYTLWLLIFLTGRGDTQLLLFWPFVIVDILRGPDVDNGCLRYNLRGKDELGLYDDGANGCEAMYATLARIIIFQAGAMLVIANLSIVFLYQVGERTNEVSRAWTQSLRTRLSSMASRKFGTSARKIIGLPMDYNEAFITAALGIAFFLPLIPICALCEPEVDLGSAWLMWMWAGVPVLFVVLPAACAVCVTMLKSRELLNVTNWLHGTWATDDAETTMGGQQLGYRFVGDAKDMVTGRPEEAATGLWNFIQADEHTVHQALKQGDDTTCLRKEWDEAFRMGSATYKDLENLTYVLEKPAGSSDKAFQFGWKRDKHPETDELLVDRLNADGGGMMLDGFLLHADARKARLSRCHVAALRLYTTSAFRSINNPLRQLSAEENEKANSREKATPKLERPHPLPITVFLIYDGLKKLRANSDPRARRHTRGSIDMGRRVSRGDSFAGGSSKPWDTMRTTLAFGAALKKGAATVLSSKQGSAKLMGSTKHPSMQPPEADGVALTPMVSRQASEQRARILPSDVSSSDGDHSANTADGLDRSSVRGSGSAAEERNSTLGELPLSTVASLDSDMFLRTSEETGPLSVKPTPLASLRNMMSRRGSQVKGSFVADSVASSVNLPTGGLQGGDVKRPPLWRGMKDMRATASFMENGGSELAPCSTTPDLHVAIKYSKDWNSDSHGGEKSLIFAVHVENFLQQGPDLSFLSCFPHEQEALYPPLTFFKPMSRVKEVISYDGTEFTIVEVSPNFPS